MDNNTPNKVMTVIIYTRVSTKEQVEGYSLAYQEKSCREYAERMGWKVIKVFREQGESAKTADRTELQNLLNFCRENKGKIDFLLLNKLDRFARNTADHQAIRAILVRYGVKIRSVTEQIDDNPAGKLMENIFSAVAQFDNDVRSERTREGMKEKLLQGYWAWKAPLGYKNSPLGLTVHSQKASYILKAFQLYGESGLTLIEIVEILTKSGFVTDTNKPLTSTQLLKLLSNKLYMGVIEVPKWGVSVDGVHKAIVTRELFYKVEARRLGKSFYGMKHLVRNHNFPLKNILSCDKCSNSLTGSYSKGRTKKYGYYHCTCGAVRVNKEQLEERFYEYLKFIQPNNDFKKMFREILITVWKRKQNDAISNLKTINKRIDDLKDLKQVLLQKNLKGIVSDLDYSEQVQIFDSEIAVKELERSELRRDEIDLDQMIGTAQNLFDNISTIWYEASFEDKQRFQKLVFPMRLPTKSDNFGTATLGLPFNLISSFASNENDLVTQRVTARKFVIPELMKYYQLFADDVAKLAYQSQSYSV